MRSFSGEAVNATIGGIDGHRWKRLEIALGRAMSGTDVAVRSAAITQWDPGFQNLVMQTVLKPKERAATAAELALLAEHAVRTGLDPMSRQIYGIYRKSRGVEVMTLQVGIDGLRSVAERTGKYLGQLGPYWCGDDGEWTDVWLRSETPRAAKVVVRKIVAGNVSETPAVAHMGEYMPMYNGEPTGQWKDKPALMLAKCAEALALRKAFPQDMSGLYTDDEMSRAPEPSAPSPAAPLPSAADIASEVVAQAVADEQPEVVDAEVVPDPPKKARPTLPEFARAAIRAKDAKQLPDEEWAAIQASEPKPTAKELWDLCKTVYGELGGDAKALHDAWKAL